MDARFLPCALTILAVAVAGALAADDEPANATSYPRTILLIRHAEKPAETVVSPDLSPQGFKRADALFELFEPSHRRIDAFPKPDFIFAARDSKMSNRCSETVAPLAKQLKVDVNSQFANEDFAKLAYELLHKRRYADKTVLVCWHHGLLPALIAQLKVTNPPDTWKAHVFDRVWEITYKRDGKTTWRDRPQRLLAGDADK
jgi:hypothetical protein